MITLPNNCRCSKLSVTPKNWNKAGANVEMRWSIHYRFYNFDGQVKHVFIRGMNRYDTLKGKQEATEDLIAYELDRLENEGYNPVTGNSIPPVNIQGEIKPTTHFAKAITDAVDKLSCSAKGRLKIAYDIKKIKAAAQAMKFDKIPVGEIRRKHIKMLLEKVAEERKLTPGTFNHYRAHLMMVFTELEDMEAVEANPVMYIKKREEIKKIKLTLTDSERKKIDEHLHAKYYTFWRYMHIFFHSGSRTAELFRLKGHQVNLEEQYFIITVIKGTNKREVKKVIKDTVLPLWEEVMEKCKPDQFVFSRNAKPGYYEIDPEQNSKRWFKFVKSPETGLGIKADFYSLKHSHSDEIAKLLSIDEAMKHNSHTSSKTTRIYAINEIEREQERLKKVGNKFA